MNARCAAEGSWLNFNLTSLGQVAGAVTPPALSVAEARILRLERSYEGSGTQWSEESLFRIAHNFSA